MGAVIRDPLCGIGGLAHGAGQLFHGRSGFLQAHGLGFGARIQIVAALGNVIGRAHEACNFRAHIAHHRAQVDLDLLQIARQWPQRGRELLAVELGGQVAGGNVAGKLPGIPHTAHDAPMEPGQHACNARQHQTQLGSPGQGTLPTQPARHHAHDDHAQQHQRQILRGRNALHTLPQATQPRVHHPAMV